MFAPRYYGGRYFSRRYFPEGGNLAPTLTGSILQAHRLAPATVPSFQDVSEVQRYLQRMIDDIARAMNSVRSVADGGTGLAALDQGEILVGGSDGRAFTRIKGNATATRKVLVSIGDGVNPGVPFWDVLDTGDVTPPTGTDVLVGVDSVLVGTDVVQTT